MRAFVTMTLVGLVLLGSGRGASGAAFDRPGYGPLRFGMTQAQVARAYPKLKLIQADHYDLQAPLKWAGRTWRTVAVIKGGRLAAVMVLTPHDPVHFRQVVQTARRDLGPPRVFRQKLLFWRQSQRVIVLGWTKIGGRPTTFMRFMPLRKTAAPQPPAKAPPRAPAKKPGLKKPASGIFRAKGEYQVCRGEVPYRFCSTRSVYGAGRTAALAIVSCNNQLTSMLAYSSIGSSRAYLTRYCRIIK